MTGLGVGGAEIHARNITRTDRFNRMNADIKHDVTSGNILRFNYIIIVGVLVG